MNQTIITTEDARRLAGMAERLRSSGRSRPDHVAALERHVATARLTDPGAVPDDVVTLNSRVRLRNLQSGRRMDVVLADPQNIALFGDQMSVAGPCGMALLGRRAGEAVNWTLGGRRRTYLVERILYQPERSGDFHL